MRYLEYNKSRRGGAKKKQKPYLATAALSRPQQPPLPPRRNYAVKHPKPSEVQYERSP